MDAHEENIGGIKISQTLTGSIATRTQARQLDLQNKLVMVNLDHIWTV